MKVVEQYQGQCDDFVLRRELRDRQARMLAFLYNAQYEITAEKFDQKFAVYSQLKNIQKNENIKTQEVKRIFMALSEKVHQRILRQQIQCDKSLNKLETLWEARKIQPFHRYYFEKYIYSTYLQNVHTLIKRQDALIRQEQHVYFSILRSIWAREACMNHLVRQLKQLSPEDMYEHFNTVKERAIQRNRKIQQRQYKVHGYRALYRLDYQQVNLDKTKMQIFFEDVNNYRKLTVHLIELIVKWKQYMWSLTHDLKKRKERIQFYYEEKNHLLRILNDSQFLAHSFLSNFYTFSVRNDPFFLRPILTLQKKKQQTDQLNFDQLQLKELIQIPPAYLPKILQAVEELHNQLDTNIRNRKAYSQFALNKVKSMSLDQLNVIKNQENSPIKRIKLESIQQNKSQQLQSTASKKNIGTTSLAKSNVIIRKSSPMVKQFSTKTFYGNNPEAPNPFKMIDSDKLKSIKEEVFRKVKQELQYETKKSLLKSKQFEQLIDFEVKASMNDLLEKQRKDLSEAVWQVSSISHREQQVGSYLAYIYKFIPFNYLQLQKSQKQLSSIIVDLQYCYFLKIHAGNDEVAHVLAKVNRQIKGYKSIEILLVAFKHGSFLQKIILRTIQFIWKYQNAKEVTFSFTTSSSQNQTFIKALKQKLQNYCSVIEKKNKNYNESKFIFIKKGVNQNYVYNPYPEQLHFKLYSLLSTQRLQQDSVRESPLVHLHYEYMVIEALKRFTNSEDFKILRDTFRPKDRFRYLLTQLIELQNHKNNEEQMTQITAQNISDLNDQLALLKKPRLQLSDINTVNCIKMIMFEMTLVPAYSMKVLSNWKGQKLHRYHLHQSISCFTDEEKTQFLMLDIQDNHHLKIVVFKASNYLQKHNKSLYSYMYPKICKFTSDSSQKFVQNIWISMTRHPENPTQQQQRYLRTYCCNEFETINKQMYIGDSLDWFTDIQIQNGLKYDILKGDVVISRPMGVGVVTTSGALLHCRIMM